MGWLDVAVAVLLAGFGVALALVLVLDSGSAFHAGLALFVFLAGALWWSYTSFAGETLSRWRQRRATRRR
jgi:hypothetical protein